MWKNLKPSESIDIHLETCLLHRCFLNPQINFGFVFIIHAMTLELLNHVNFYFLKLTWPWMFLELTRCTSSVARTPLAYQFSVRTVLKLEKPDISQKSSTHASWPKTFLNKSRQLSSINHIVQRLEIDWMLFLIFGSYLD